jgi:hypothetical protein
MAEFVKPDGTAVQSGQVILPLPTEGLVGYIDNFKITNDPMRMERIIEIQLRLSEADISDAGGLVPHIKRGSKVEIRAVR